MQARLASAPAAGNGRNTPPPPPLPGSSPSSPCGGATSSEEREGDGAEFAPEEGDPSEDDEATMAEEERCAAADGNDDAEAEAAALRAEAQMPLHELMRHYGVQRQPAPAGGAPKAGAAPPTQPPRAPPLPAPRVAPGGGHLFVAAAVGVLPLAQAQARGGAGASFLPLPPLPSAPRRLPHLPVAPWPPPMRAPVAAAARPAEGAALAALAAPQSAAQLRAQAMRDSHAAALRDDQDELLLAGREAREAARVRLALAPAEPEKLFRPVEVSRRKTHWDHVLEEMAWLAKDSDRERKWKRKAARKAAVACKGSGRDIASKALACQVAEQASLRRIASFCAREVRMFWGKAERLVRIQAQGQLDARRQSAMDKHLQFVMAQTERYCALVAGKMGGGAGAGAAAGPSGPAHPSQLPDDAADDAAFAPDDPSSDDEATLEEEERCAVAAGEGGDTATELALLAAEREAPLESLLPPEVLARYRGTAPPSPPPSPPHHEDSDSDVRLSDQDTADEEETMAAEEAEAAARGEGGADAHAAEMEALQMEAELPLEQLMARYCADAAARGEPSDDEADVEEEEGSGSESEGGEGDEPMAGTPRAAAAPDSGSDSDGGEQRWAEVLMSTPAGADVAEARRQGLERVAAEAASAVGGARTPVPFLLRATLREYQREGLDWLVALYEKQLNGILADEMVRACVCPCGAAADSRYAQGLGKTIQTIALLAHLAASRGIWGPHLIVVPTSVMLNWETEFKRFCPALKLLTYFGTAKERKLKRAGWSKANAFHVCVTTYRLVTQDARVFRRKKWKYLILDEAHMIKNWRSQRWQTLLHFQTKRRLLLTGTPLQNDLMELWSLMHFLMPHVFASHADFKAWFSQPLTSSVEQGGAINRELVGRLHGVLRPFLLRRLKADVEKSLPSKTEHVVPCPLSKRQRRLYEEYMQCSSTQGTLASGNLMGIMNVLMQLRKVCNHPDLFEGRPIVSPLDWTAERYPRIPALLAVVAADARERASCDTPFLGCGLVLAHAAAPPPLAALASQRLALGARMVQELQSGSALGGHSRRIFRQRGGAEAEREVSLFTAAANAAAGVWRRERIACLAQLSFQRIAAAADGAASGTRTLASAGAGASLRALLACPRAAAEVIAASARPERRWQVGDMLRSLVHSPAERAQQLDELLCATVFAIPRARAAPPAPWAAVPLRREAAAREALALRVHSQLLPRLDVTHSSAVRRQVFFPDRRLIQFDCGKLQELATLLRERKSGGHKCLIFTQMTKMLDLLAAFLNLYGYTYVRLDGSTKPEQRQILMQRFNTDPRIFCFILSTRSGGFGINLVGADSVIFYDSDWNPAMDSQAQDRAHRIGQTRPVHIYRLVCTQTIEENILKKATQKKQLDWMAIQSGQFSTEFFTQPAQAPVGGAGTGAGAGAGSAAMDPRDFFEGMPGYKAHGKRAAAPDRAATAAELAAAMRSVEDDMDVAAGAVAEQEQAAEVAEFAEDVRPLVEDDDDQAPGAPTAGADSGDEAAPADAAAAAAAAAAARQAESDAALAAARALAAAEEDEVQARVARVTAAAASAGCSIWDALSPVERYALRFVSAHLPPQLPEGQLAAVQFQEEAWDAEAIERHRQQAEAAAEEEEDPLAVEAWDADAATEAYRRELQRAQREAQQQAAAQQAAQQAAEARALRRAAAAEAAAAARAEAEEAPHSWSLRSAPAPPPPQQPMLKLKVKLTGTEVGASPPDLGVSRAGRKRKLTQLPGAEDELVELPASMWKKPRERDEQTPEGQL